MLLKLRLLDLARGTSNGLSASADTTNEILQLADQLKQPWWETRALSRRLDGRWRLVFTTTKGSSAGKIGPFVGDVFQDIDTSEGRYVNVVSLPLVEGRLGASWDVTGLNEWRVKFQDISFKLSGVTLIDKVIDATGVWRMTYLDEDLRILWARGKDAAEENIYILQRVS